MKSADVSNFFFFHIVFKLLEFVVFFSATISHDILNHRHFSDVFALRMRTGQHQTCQRSYRQLWSWCGSKNNFDFFLMRLNHFTFIEFGLQNYLQHSATNVYRTALHYASKSSDIVRYLLQFDTIDKNAEDVANYVADVISVQQLICTKFTLSASYKTILHIECKLGNLQLVRELIESKGFDVRKPAIFAFFCF